VGKVILDGEVLKEKLDYPSLLELVAYVEGSYINKENIVVEVTVNEERLSEFTFEDGTLIPYDPDCELTILTRPLKDILISSLDEFDRYLERLIPGLHQIAELFRANELDDGNKLYIDAIDGIRVMIELIQGISSSNTIDFMEPRYDGISLLDMSDMLKKSMEALVTVQSDGDYSRMADILDKELTNALTHWHKVLPLLKEEIAKG
jgi:hypothetical protein